jgi:hypothetical protein
MSTCLLQCGNGYGRFDGRHMACQLPHYTENGTCRGDDEDLGEQMAYTLFTPKRHPNGSYPCSSLQTGHCIPHTQHCRERLGGLLKYYERAAA